jgi:hypothetical protein
LNLRLANVGCGSQAVRVYEKYGACFYNDLLLRQDNSLSGGGCIFPNDLRKPGSALMTVAYALKTAFFALVGLICLYVLIRFLTGMAIFLAIFLVALLPAYFLGDQLNHRSSFQVRKAVTFIGRGCLIVLWLAFIGASIFAIWSWYPFYPIFDIPLGRLTLNQILGTRFGAFLFVAIPVAIAKAGKAAYEDDGDVSAYAEESMRLGSR